MKAKNYTVMRVAGLAPHRVSRKVNYQIYHQVQTPVFNRIHPHILKQVGR